jgi:Questin oxidase-like
MSATLHALLSHGEGFDAEYASGLSNHLPMALMALHRLGADATRLQAFAKAYTERLRPAPAAQTWPAGDPWRERFGQPEAYSAYRHFFREWLTYEDASVVLQTALPALMGGCGGAAFHGLIRCAYAVQAMHAGELADALAYWACRHLVLAPAPKKAGTLGLAEMLAALPTARAGDAPLIFQRMKAVAAQRGFASAAQQLRIDALTLQELAQHAATLYAHSGDFVALHLVTSAHALRLLLPFVDAPELALRDYALAYSAAYAAAAVKPGVAPKLRTWATIVKAALASSDEHVIKLVDSCREEQAAYGGTVWRQAASAALA